MKEGNVLVLPLQLLPCAPRANRRGGRCAGESLSHPHLAAGFEERRRSGKYGSEPAAARTTELAPRLPRSPRT